jgi:hypothetical protein
MYSSPPPSILSFPCPLCSGSISTPSGNNPISPFGLMGKVLSNRRRREIERQIQNMGLNQIIRDFVIDLSPFIIPSDEPTNHGDSASDSQFISLSTVTKVT